MTTPIQRHSLLYRMPLNLKYVVILCTIIQVINGQFEEFVFNEETEDLIQSRAFHFKDTPVSIQDAYRHCQNRFAKLWSISPYDNLTWVFQKAFPTQGNELDFSTIWQDHRISINAGVRLIAAPNGIGLPSENYLNQSSPYVGEKIGPSTCLAIRSNSSTQFYLDSVNCEENHYTVCVKDGLLFQIEHFAKSIVEDIFGVGNKTSENSRKILKLKKILQNTVQTYHTWREHLFQALTLVFGVLSVFSIATAIYACKQKRQKVKDKEIEAIKEKSVQHQYQTRYRPSAPYHPPLPEEIPFIEVQENPGSSVKSGSRTKFVASVSLHKNVATRIMLPTQHTAHQ